MTLPDLPFQRDVVPGPDGARFPRPGQPSLSCSRCNLVIYPRVATIAPHHCPRCMARRKLAVMLERRE